MNPLFRVRERVHDSMRLEPWMRKSVEITRTPVLARLVDWWHERKCRQQASKRAGAIG